NFHPPRMMYGNHGAVAGAGDPREGPGACPGGESLMRKILAMTICLAACLAWGCANRIPPPKTAAEGGPPPAEAWERVLSRHVDAKGRIDFSGIAADRGDLDTFVDWVARVSPASDPGSFPTSQARLAYYINAYNALAVYDVLASNFPPD